MKKKILIISGGISKERIISLETGRQVAKELKKNNYIVKTCEPDKDLISVTKSFKPHILHEWLPGRQWYFLESWGHPKPCFKPF